MSATKDPVRGLEHDHVVFSDRVAQVKALLCLRPSGDVATDLRTLRLVESLRDDLLVHFAKEEEGLFPFVTRELPGLAADVDRLLAGHETVCGCIVRLAHGVGRGPGVDETVMLLFDRFERAYVEHSRSEVLVLREVGGQLGADQRRDLAALLESL